MSAGLMLLEFTALLAGAAAIGLAICMLEPEDTGRLSERWLRRQRREGREQ